jgi:hypothetical protein
MARRPEVNELLGLLDGPVQGRIQGAATALRLGVRWAADRCATRVAPGW